MGIVRHLLPVLGRRMCKAEVFQRKENLWRPSPETRLERPNAGCREPEQLLDHLLNKDKRKEGLRYNLPRGACKGNCVLSQKGDSLEG